MNSFIDVSNLQERMRAMLRNGPYDLGPYGGNFSALVRGHLGLKPAKLGRPPKKWAARIAMHGDDMVPVFEISALDFPRAASALVGEFGQPATGINGPSGTMIFRHSVGNTPTHLGFRLAVNESVRLDCAFPREFDNIPLPVWTRDKIIRTSCIAVADCVLRFEAGNGKDEKGAILCRGFCPSAFFDGLEDGKIYADFDLRANQDGEIFGLVAFCIRATDFPSLYESARRVTARQIPSAVRPV